MKKILSLILCCLMLLSACSGFAEGKYLTATPLTVSGTTLNLLDEGISSEIMLSTESAYIILSHNPSAEAEFVVFPIPEGCRTLAFTTRKQACYNPGTGCLYDYQLMKSDSTFEDFLAEGQQEYGDGYTLISSGLSGWAAYTYTSSTFCGAQALVKTGSSETAPLLWIHILYLGDPEGDGRRYENLSTATLASYIATESTRLRSGMKAEASVPYWTENGFDGFTMFSDMTDSKHVMMTYTFPEMVLTLSDGKEEKAREFVTAMSGPVDTMLRFSVASLEIEYDLDSYSFTEYMREQEPENVHTVRLADGYTYDIYCTVVSGAIYYVYVSRLLTDEAGYNGSEPLYFTIEFVPNGVSWSDLDHLCEDLNRMVTQISWDATFDFMNGEATANPEPTVGPVEPTATPMPAPLPVSVGWDCPNCQTHNESNFCTFCGTKRPEDNGIWICPGCGRENDTNFCPDCGTAKP